MFPRRQAVARAGLSPGWTAAVDRFARAVHRYRDRVEMLPDRSLRQELTVLGDVLDASLSSIRTGSRTRHLSSGDDGAAVRAVLRAGTLCAQATEAAVAAAAARREQRPADIRTAVATVRALTDEVRDLSIVCLPQPARRHRSRLRLSRLS